MDFLLAFLEGIISFLSPCILPMLPVYVIYFTADGKNNDKKTLFNALAFVFGFSIIFTLLGTFSGFVGEYLIAYHRVFDIISGIFVILLGLNFLGIINVPFLNHHGGSGKKVEITGMLSAFLFGVMFSVTWTPCAASFLGSALVLAANRASMGEGALMLLCYSVGLGVPFVLSAVLIDKLKSAFNFIKKNYNIINKISGILLIVLGILFLTGLMDRFEAIFI